MWGPSNNHVNLSKLTSILDKTLFQITISSSLIKPLIKKILNPKHSLYKGAPAYPINIAYLINNYPKLCLLKTIPAYYFMLKQIPYYRRLSII